MEKDSRGNLLNYKYWLTLQIADWRLQIIRSRFYFGFWILGFGLRRMQTDNSYCGVPIERVAEKRPFFFIVDFRFQIGDCRLFEAVFIFDFGF
jgi:hypothetical protein